MLLECAAWSKYFEEPWASAFTLEILHRETVERVEIQIIRLNSKTENKCAKLRSCFSR